MSSVVKRKGTNSYCGAHQWKAKLAKGVMIWALPEQRSIK